ncbi:MAG: Ig-like domain-containing protein [Gemmatimonadales bacterium]
MHRHFKVGAVIAGALVAACGLAASGPHVSRIEAINIAPGRVSLQPFQAADLIVDVVLSRGDSGALATLQWHTTGGVISNNYVINGVRHVTYQSPAQVGNYLFIVTTVTGFPADTAQIAVATTPVPVHTVTVIPSSVNLVVGDTTLLRAALTDSTGSALFGRGIEWTTSDAGVATVLASGFVRAISAGTVTITATAEGHSGTAVINVAPAPTP